MKSIVWVAIGILLLVGQEVSAQGNSPVKERVLSAQSKGKPYAAPGVFKRLGDPDPSMQRVLKRGSLLSLDKKALRDLKSNKPEFLVLDLPFENGRTLTVELVKNKVLDAEFKVSTSAPIANGFTYESGLYYQGVVRGPARSVAAISIIGEELIGVIDVDGLGNFILGEVENDAEKRYAFYRTDDLVHDMKAGCDTEDVPANVANTAEQISVMNTDPNRCVKIYFECEYDMYASRGSSVQSTVDFMTGIYNVVKTLYDNENVNTAISEIFVWNTPDDYPVTGTADALYAFRTKRGTTFNGNLAHLISRGAPSGGGVAFLDVSCSKGSAYAYSYIYATYSQLPTYSWTVNVIAHEMGHNLGSSHTHGCVWDVNGDGTANEMIDGCGPNKGYTEGSCPIAPLPTNGGTVMSYCHLVSGVGINMNNGFGKLPGDRIRSRVYNGTCFTACSTCATTVSFSKTDVTCNGGNNGSATATGNGSTGGYTYLWSTGATTATVTGLAAGTYTVTVKGENGLGCPINASVTIGQPAAITATANISPEAVAGAGNGAIDLTVSGGTLPYSYLWSNGSITQDLINLSAGTYNVTITDSKGCSLQRSYTVASNGCSQQLSSFPVTEDFETNLGLFTQATNDNYDWTRQTGSTPNSRTGPTGAYQGSWYIFAQGKNNTGDASVESPCLAITNVTNPAINFAYSMNGNNIGTLRLDVSTNNGGSWTTLWSRTGKQGTAWFTASVSLNDHKSAFTKIRFVATAGGTAGDIAIDAINFAGQATVNCTAPTLSFSKTDASCFGSSNGSATVTATGGTAPYTYAWSSGATTASISNLAAGTYSVTVTTNGGCTATGQVTIAQPEKIEVATEAVPVSAPGASDGAVNLNLVRGGNAPFKYRWNNGDTTKDIINIPAGTYSVVVNDAVGCATNASETVTEPGVSKCANTGTLPYAESFETGLGSWVQATDDQFDWRRNSGGTSTANTGPTGAGNGTFYLYTEANDASGGSRAVLESPCFDLGGLSQAELSLFWHMFGNQMGSMIIEISQDGGVSWSQLWSRSGNASTSWTPLRIPLTAYLGKTVTFRITGILGNGPRGDMAIDDIKVTGQSASPMLITSTEDQQNFDLRKVYPNPTSGNLQVEIYSPATATANVSLVDVTGRSKDYGKVSLSQGLNTIRLNVSTQQQGMYLIRVQENGRNHTRPVMIMK